MFFANNSHVLEIHVVFQRFHYFFEPDEEWRFVDRGAYYMDDL